MKTALTMITAGLISLFLSSCFFFPGRHVCYAKPVAGRVIDSDTGKGIANAKIEYFPFFSEDSELPKETCHTDPNGFFMLKDTGVTRSCGFLVPPSIMPLDTYTYGLKISAIGYKTSLVNINLAEIFVCIDLDRSVLQDYLVGSGFIIVTLHPSQ